MILQNPNLVFYKCSITPCDNVLTSKSNIFKWLKVKICNHRNQSFRIEVSDRNKVEKKNWSNEWMAKRDNAVKEVKAREKYMDFSTGRSQWTIRNMETFCEEVPSTIRRDVFQDLYGRARQAANKDPNDVEAANSMATFAYFLEDTAASRHAQDPLGKFEQAHQNYQAAKKFACAPKN